MSRYFYYLALAIVALHGVEIVWLGTSPAGSTFSNLLQILASAIATWTAYQASQRGHGFTRRFWLLIAVGMATWGMANTGWLYYEGILQKEPPIGSMVRFLFDTQFFFFAVAMFLDQEYDSQQFELESLLDSVQIGIVFFFVFLGLYFIPAQHFTQSRALLQEANIMAAEAAALILISGIQAFRSRTREFRKLYLHFCMYLTFYAVCAGIANYMQYLHNTPTGTWFDLAWTIPLLAGANWAARWQPEPAQETPVRLRHRTLAEMIFSNATFAIAPLIVLLQIAGLGSEWRTLRFSLLGISILCFAARLGLSEYRASRSLETARLHALAMDSSVDGMTIVNRQGIYIYANAAYARMLDYDSPQAMVNKYWKDIADPGRTKTLVPQIRDALQKTGRWFGPLTVNRRDGTTFSLEMAVTLLPDGGAVCVSRDISDRRSAETAREKAETKYRMIVEQVAAITYIAELGVNGLWHYVSPQVLEFLGFTQDEWLANSRDWLNYVYAEDHLTVQAAEDACLKDGRFQAEYRLIRKDGQVIWVNDTAVVVSEKDGAPLMEGIIVDITERKHLEMQLQQSHRMEAVGRLAGGIAHDFNNLLTIIKGYAELAVNRANVPAPILGDLQQIGDASERATSLVRQLLAFSRRQVLQPRSLDINSIVQGLDKLLQRLMGADIEMITSCSLEAGVVKADPAQIEQVIMNLVVNARDAMPTGGRLVIETSNVELDANYARDHASFRPGPYVMLAVSDTGIGMDIETQAHIFEPFYTTKAGKQGTGLGLATVYGIVKQSGGYIWVYSEPGKGSTFKVYLPRIQQAADAPVQASDKTPVRKGTETILLVEDEEGVRSLSELILKEQGYNVLVAHDTNHAEKIAEEKRGKIQLLLTDVVMPGMSGRELAKRISSSDSNIRVLFMSGYTDNVIAQGGVLEAGVAFLQKPFSPRALAGKVREVLDVAQHIRS